MNIFMIADSLTRLRLANGYSLEAVANCLGVSIYTYAKFEAGEEVPNALQMFALVRFYGSTLDTVYGITDSKCSKLGE